MKDQSKKKQVLIQELSDLRRRIQDLEQSESGRKQAEEELNANKRQLSNALEMAHLGHWEYDIATDLFTFNDQFYKIFRIAVEQVGGYTMHSAEYAHRFVHPDDSDIVGEEIRTAIETTDPHFNRQIDHRILYADGTVGYITVLFFIVKDSHSRTVKIYGVNQDITERKRMEADILALSITDHLTGLNNRRGFISLAEQQLKLSIRNKRGMLFFFADLDGLKWINDTFSHEEGDRVLVEAAIVWRETFRTSDIIARLGGDEYAALCVDIAEANSEIFTTRLQYLIDKLNTQENRRYRLSISVGCSYYDPENPSTIDELMSHADELMYDQKKSKRS